jgi:hypothetical protein
MTHFHFTAGQFARALAVAVVLSGTVCCFASAQLPPILAFANKSVLNVDATSLDLKIENVPPREYPHMGYRSQVRFDDTAREWAAAHFMLTGKSVNQLRVTIRKGDIVEKLLPVKKGIKGWFTKDQSAEYEATLDVELSIVDVNGMVLTSASGKSTSTRTVSEGTTDADKQQVWTGMIVAAFDALDNELQPQVRQVMAQFIR